MPRGVNLVYEFIDLRMEGIKPLSFCLVDEEKYHIGNFLVNPKICT